MGDEGQFVDQSGIEEMPHDGDPGHHRDLAALFRFEIADKGVDIALDELRVLPVELALEGARGDEFRHLVDEIGEIAVGFCVRPVARPVLIALASENDGVDPFLHLGQHRAEVIVERISLPLIRRFDHAVDRVE